MKTILRSFILFLQLSYNLDFKIRSEKNRVFLLNELHVIQFSVNTCESVFTKVNSSNNWWGKLTGTIHEPEKRN